MVMMISGVAPWPVEDPGRDQQEPPGDRRGATTDGEKVMQIL